jgi:hypothetical protein
MADGREVCNLLTKDGRDEYDKRKRIMWKRQKKRCCLFGFIDGCSGDLPWSDAMFEHESGRGMSGGHREDRIEIDGKWVNGVAHARCNSLKGSRRIYYNG